MHQNIDPKKDYPEIPYLEEYADAALLRYNKVRRLRLILKFSSVGVVILLTVLGHLFLNKTDVRDSLAQLPSNENRKANEMVVSTESEQFATINSNSQPKDYSDESPTAIRNNSEKNTIIPKDLKSQFVPREREVSELENPAVDLWVSVSSGTVTAERQPELFTNSVSQLSDTSRSNDNPPRSLRLISYHKAFILPAIDVKHHHQSLPLPTRCLKPFISMGIGGYSSLGVARFKDPALIVGVEYPLRSCNILYSAARVYSITGLNNPYISIQKTYTDVSHETRTTYQTDRLYMAGIEIGAGHRMGPYLLKAGLAADYMVTGENTLTEEKWINQRIVSSETTSEKGYVKGYRDLSFAANLGIARHLISGISAGASIQFGLQDITRNEVFKSGDKHINSVAQFFLKYQWQQ